MPFIEWSEDLSVHVAEIDAQHRKLIGIVNELYDAMTQGRGRKIIGEIVDRLVDYCGYHFTTEETYFVQYGYPETISHKEEHAYFTKKVQEFQARYKRGDIGLTIDVMNFLRDWLEDHLKGTDSKYVDFFHKKGIY